jgi:hypothetical protein
MKQFESSKRGFVIFSLSRSGHHSIIDYIYENLAKDKFFLNNPKDLEMPLKERVYFYFNKNKYFNKKNFNQIYLDDKILNERKKGLQKLSWISEPKKLEIPLKLKNIIINLENYDFINYNKEINIYLNKICKNIKTKIAIIIIRNPFNLLASRIKHGRPITSQERKKNKINLEKFIRLWKKYALFFINKKNLEGFDKTILISYDKWISSANSRKKYCKELQIKYKYFDLQKIPFFGGGSSFEGYSPTKGKNKLNLLERYKELINSHRKEDKQLKRKYINLFKKHPEIKELSEKIFGETKGINF